MIIQNDMLFREVLIKAGDVVFGIKRECVITKDEFLACYNKWIKETNHESHS